MLSRRQDLMEYYPEDTIRQLLNDDDGWLCLRAALHGYPSLPAQGEGAWALYRLWYARLRAVGGEQCHKAGFPGLAMAALLTQARLQLAEGELSVYYIFTAEPEADDDGELALCCSAWQHLRALCRMAEALSLWQYLVEPPETALSAWPSLAAAGQALTDAAATFLTQPLAWGNWTPAEIDQTLSALMQPLTGLAEAFFAARQAYMEQVRRQLNTPAESIRLAERYESYDEATALVIFSHGTCVYVEEDDLWPEEDIATAARRLLRDSECQGPLQFMTLDADEDDAAANSPGDALGCVIQSSLGSMNGIFNYYWESEEWWLQDEEIARAYRLADREETKPSRILGGWEQQN